MAANVRNVVGEHPEYTGPQVYKALAEKFPEQDINEGSCTMAVYAARKKLGISGGKKKKKPGPKPGTPKQTAAPQSSGKVNLEALQAAAKFLGQVGDADTAADALKQVKSLQVK